MGQYFGNWVLVDGPDDTKTNEGKKCSDAAMEMCRKFPSIQFAYAGYRQSAGMYQGKL